MYRVKVIPVGGESASRGKNTAPGDYKATARAGDETSRAGNAATRPLAVSRVLTDRVRLT